MNAAQTIRRGPAGNHRGVAILAGSAGLHLLFLALIGLDMATRADLQIAEDRPLILDLEPWPDFARRAGPVSRPTAQPVQVAEEPLPSLPSLRQPSPIETAAPPSPVSAANSSPEAPVLPPTPPAVSRADAVGAGLVVPNGWRGDVCRNPSDFAAWQAARCGEIRPSARAELRDAREAEAAIGERRGDASERRREDAFARQKALNDRWLEYYRYRDAPYPGLRSLPSQL